MRSLFYQRARGSNNPDHSDKHKSYLQSEDESTAYHSPPSSVIDAVGDMFSSYSSKSNKTPASRSLFSSSNTSSSCSVEISRLSQVWECAKEDLQAKTERVRWLKCENAALLEQVAQLKAEANTNQWRLTTAERRCDTLSTACKELRQRTIDGQYQVPRPSFSRYDDGATQNQQPTYAADRNRRDSVASSSSTSSTPSSMNRDQKLLNVSIGSDNNRTSTSRPRTASPRHRQKCIRTNRSSCARTSSSGGDVSKNDPSSPGWVVGEVSAIVSRFQAASGNRVPNSIEQRLVLELVAYVRKREDGTRSRIRSQVQRTIGTLRRRLKHSQPYDECILVAKIERLEDEIADLREKEIWK